MGTTTFDVYVYVPSVQCVHIVCAMKRRMLVRWTWPVVRTENIYYCHLLNIYSRNVCMMCEQWLSWHCADRDGDGFELSVFVCCCTMRRCAHDIFYFVVKLHNIHANIYYRHYYYYY